MPRPITSSIMSNGQENVENIRRRQEGDMYRQANKDSNTEVAISKAHAMYEVYREMEKPDGERKIFRIATLGAR